jgi:hypothetical protein
MDFEIISRSINQLRTLDKNFVVKVINGTARSQDVLTYDLYSSIYRIRHDAIHWLICQERDKPFGEKHIEDLEIDAKIKNHKNYKLIKNQSPDIIDIKENKIEIIEITISRMKMADIQKLTKYKLLVNVLEECGFDVTLEVIVINTFMAIPDRDLLKNVYKFSEQLIEDIYTVIINVDNLLHDIHESDKGYEWLSRFKNMIVEPIQFDLTDDDVILYIMVKGIKHS